MSSDGQLEVSEVSHYSAPQFSQLWITSVGWLLLPALSCFSPGCLLTTITPAATVDTLSHRRM